MRVLFILLIFVFLVCEKPEGQLLYEEDFESYNEGRFSPQTEGWKIGWKGTYPEADSFDFIKKEQTKVLEIVPPGLSENFWPALLYLDKEFKDFSLQMRARLEYSTQGSIEIGVRCDENQGYLVILSSELKVYIKRIDSYREPVEALLKETEIPFDIADKKWHDIRITIIGDSLSLLVDGSEIVSLSRLLYINREGKIGFVSGPEDYYEIDDLRVYSE